MNTLYITNSGRVMLDENGNPSAVDYCREAISNIFYLKNDTHIVYDREEKKAELDAKAGDLVVTFYEKDFPNPIVVVDSKEWKDNLETYNALEQKRKEEWAAKNKECSNCDNCEACCKG